MKEKLKVGLIVDSAQGSKYVYELAAWANTTATLRVTHLIIQEPARAAVSRGNIVARFFSKSPLAHAKIALWKAKARLEAGRVARVKAYDGAQGSYDLATVVPGAIRIAPLVSKSGFVRRFGDSDLATLRQEGFDVLIRCGTGILKGGILDSARFGILSFHHGDNRINRGGPPGFWEVYHRQARTGFVVQRLTEELDGGDVILRGYIPTQDTHLLNVAMLYAKSYARLRPLLLEIAQTGRLPESEAQYPYSGQLLVAPTLSELLAYLSKQIVRSVSARVRVARGYRERWGIYFMKAGWRHAVMRRGTRVTTPAGRFLADPFVVTRDGRTCVFAEDYVYSTGKGHISVFEITPAGARELGEVVNESFHLSFPFLFEFAGTLFMCPESGEARQIRIYECVEFPLKWQLKVVAMDKVAAADSMIFPKDGIWWLLTNISRTEPHDSGSELSLFWATTPLSDAWQPHPRNPIVSDPLSARNGGLLRDEGELIRVAQGRKFCDYGTSARLFRVTRLDREEYAEEMVSNITPEFAPGIHGAHHFHSDGVYSVWDFKQWERI